MPIRVTQGSRTNFAPRPGDIPEVRTVVPDQRHLPQQSQSAAALKALGADVKNAGEEFARIGAIQQARDEDREAQARVMRFRQDLFDHTYGNEDKSIRGYSQVKGQESLDSGQTFRDTVEELKNLNGTEIVSPRVRAAFDKAAAQHQLSFSSAHSAHMANQRNLAEVATNAADLNLYTNEMISAGAFAVDPLTGNPILGANGQRQLNPHLIAAESGIVAKALEIAKQQGITDPDVIAERIKQHLTNAHKQVLKHLLADQSQGIEAAREYYRQVRGGIVDSEKAAILTDLNTAGDLEGGRKAAEEVTLVGGTHKEQVARIKHMDLTTGEEKEAIRLVDANALRNRQAEAAAERKAMTEAYFAAEQGKLEEFLRDPDNVEDGTTGRVVGSRAFANVQNRQLKAIQGTVFARGVTPQNTAISTAFRSLDNDVEKANFDLASVKDKLTKAQHDDIEKTIVRARGRLDSTLESTTTITFGHKQINELVKDIKVLTVGTTADGRKRKAGQRASKRINAAKTDLDNIIQDFRVAAGKDMHPTDIRKAAQRLLIPIISDPEGISEDERKLPKEAILADAIGKGAGAGTVSKKQFEAVEVKDEAIKEHPFLDAQVNDAIDVGGGRKSTGLRQKVAGALLTGNHARLETLLPGFWAAKERDRPGTLQQFRIDEKGKSTVPLKKKRREQPPVTKAVPKSGKDTAISMALGTLRNDEGGATTDFDGTPLLDLGVQEARRDSLQKKLGRKLKPGIELATAVVEEDYETLSTKMAGFKAMPPAAQAAVLDVTYTMGAHKIMKFKAMSKAMKDGDIVEVARQTLDTANQGGKSMKGIARRRARKYNAAVPPSKRILKVKQDEDGRITYFGRSGVTILTYKPVKGKHHRSDAGTVKP